MIEPRRVILGNTVMLTPPVWEDAKEYLTLINSSVDYLSPWMNWKEPTSFNLDIIREYFERCDFGFQNRTSFQYLIKLKSNSQLIGSLSVYKINWKNNSVNIGYWMAENFTRKGYTSESLEYLMKYLKEIYINKIYAFTFTNNTGSIKVLEKKGFILLKNITVGKRDASIYCLTIGRGENMELGLGKNEVRLTSHDPRWKLEFEIIKNEIIQNTDIAPDNIEHIGSTSIPGIDAKPIIDVLIGVDDLEESAKSYKEGLLNVGVYRLRVQRENEIVFAKDKCEEIRTHYIHMVKYKGELWNDLVFFRDFLNQNKEYRKEYENLKKSLAEENSEGIDKYTAQKEKFIKKIAHFRN